MSVLTNPFTVPSFSNKTSFIAFTLIKKIKENFASRPLLDIAQPNQAVPLSKEQQNIWFGQINSSNPFVFNTLNSIVIRGELNSKVLDKSMRKVVQRQQILQTTFSTTAGNVSQKVSIEMRLVMQKRDFSSLSYVESKEQLNKLIGEQARQSFNMEQGPLVRLFLVRLSEKEHILLLFMHRLIFDSSSMPVLLRELAQAYQAILTNSLDSLPPLRMQYADYVNWQQNFIKQLHANDWTMQPQTEWPVLELPVDKLRPAIKQFNASTYSFKMSAGLSYTLKAIAEKNDTSLFNLLLTLFYTLLYRYTGQEDIIIGTPIYYRDQESTENLIGLFSSILPLRQQMYGEISFIKLLHAIHNMANKARQEGDILVEKTPHESIPDQLINNPLLYQALFELKYKAVAPVHAHQVTFEHNELHNGIADCDLSLTIHEVKDELICVFAYDTDLFEVDTIVRMATHFTALTESIVTDPSQKISQLTILPQTERNLLLSEWNQTKVPYPGNKCVHDLFEEQAEKTPHAIAIIFEDTHLTYKQLNEKANQLANYLQGKGVGTETMVGICVERSLELIIGLLGILKAGGAFVPLDTSYPIERLLFMLEDTGVNLLVTEKKLENYFSKNVSQIVLLDDDWQKIAGQSTSVPQSNVQSENLLYVMYTSGSTGKPKGVSTLHKGVVRLVKNTNYAHLDEHEVLLQYAPVTFDASTLEIWGSLLNGGKLIIMSKGATTLEELKHTIQKHQVTTLWLSAGLFHLMIDNGIEELTSLRQLLAGGEALSINHVRKAYTLLKSCKIINGYGPTENTTFTCCYEVTNKGLSRSSVPIGRPINNTTVYILDKYLQPVPIGIAGELYTGGDGLARNYFNRPDLTAEKFIPNPFAVEPDQFLYKTGDLVRYLPDGNIEFLGRIDNQVKIRGFRIELGEIEAILGRHAHVKESVVIVREDTPGDKRIVAYVVSKDKEAVEVAQLQEYLKDHMPSYMLPSAIVSLDYLPLTLNGKVNKKALPEPEHRNPSGGTYIVPSTEAEKLLAQIWKQVLGIDKVSVEDNFFDLGGHSLLAVKLFAQIKSTTGKELPISTLYANPVLAQLARCVEGKTGEDPWQSLVCITKSKTKQPLYFIHHGGGTLEYAQRLALYLDKDQPVYGLQPIGLNGVDTPLNTIEAMAAYYTELIISNQPEGPYQLAGYSTGGYIAYEIARRLTESGKKVKNLFILDTYPNYTKYTYHGLALRYMWMNTVNLFTSYENLKHFYENKSPRKIAYNFIFDLAMKIRKVLLLEPETIVSEEEIKKNLKQAMRKKFLAVSFKAEKNYTTKLYYGPLVFIRAIENEVEYVRNSDLGWKKIVKGKITIYDVAQTHHTLFDSEANANHIAGLIQKHLDESNIDLERNETSKSS